MDKRFYFCIITTLLFCTIGCRKSETPEKEDQSTPQGVVYDSVTVAPESHKNPIEFIPEGYKPFDTIYGDLNKDGTEDLVYIIKGTDKSKFFNDNYRGELDRNRRGIMILFKKHNSYELVVKNEECFSSENEDGGVYFAPELDIEIKKGNLFVNYAHGRYGYWAYNFRYRNNDFELIGYDVNYNMGPVTQSITSYNFLTRKKQYRENINRDDPDAEEVFQDTWTKIKAIELVKLSEISDFDELDFDEDSNG